MVIAARKSNEVYLSGESENQWGFGQVVPLVLLSSVIAQCLGAFISECYPMYPKDDFNP